MGACNWLQGRAARGLGSRHSPPGGKVCDMISEGTVVERHSNAKEPPYPDITVSPIVGCVGPRRGRVSWNVTRICRAFEWGDAVAFFTRTVPRPDPAGRASVTANR